MTPREVLAAYAPAAGLKPTCEPFSKASTLKDRFAANPFLMAPMAGVSDGAYRLMARSGGASLAYSEMVSVTGLHYGSNKTWDLVMPADGEPDIAIQLFGSKPEEFKEATAAITDRLGEKLVLIDINMACPVPKVIHNDAGSYLLDVPKRSQDIVRACISETKVPVTVKIRRGRNFTRDVAVDFAMAMEDAGASAIAIHGRFARELYRFEAKWEAIAKVAEAVRVPVIGSGDVFGAEVAAERFRDYGCAAVMVARGSCGNPWIFDDANAILRGEEPLVHSMRERLAALRCHILLLDATQAHLARARSLCAWYLKGLPHASALRNRAMSCSKLDEFIALIDEAESALDDEPDE